MAYMENMPAAEQRYVIYRGDEDELWTDKASRGKRVRSMACLEKRGVSFALLYAEKTMSNLCADNNACILIGSRKPARHLAKHAYNVKMDREERRLSMKMAERMLIWLTNIVKVRRC